VLHRQSSYRSVLCLLLLVTVRASVAGELLHALVTRQDDHYLLHLDMRIQAKRAEVYRILTDCPQLPQVNSAIKSAKELSHKGQVYRVRLISEGCVWIFCRRVKEVDDVTLQDAEYLMVVTDPTHSDLRYGRALWQLIDEGKTTRIKYNADFVPGFWVPPLIGPALLKHVLLKQGLKTINGIERLVQPQH
jgi:hypothetical protein